MKRPLCWDCGLITPYGRYTQGGLCSKCRTRRSRNPEPCPGCGLVRPLASRLGDLVVCATCAGEESIFACTGCGSEDEPYSVLQCARCALVDRLIELLTDPASGTIRRELEPVFQTLAGSERPRSTLWWLGKTPHLGADRLSEMARGQMPISHDAFRQLPPHQAHKYLRDLLTAVGVLEPYEPLLDGMQPWVDDKLAQVPAAQREIVRRYAHWKVIRHMIKLHEQGRLTAAATNAARNRITAAIAMLDYFAQHDATAATATQALVEAYVAGRTSFASLEYSFVTWLRTSRINPGIRLPTPPGGPPTLTLGHEDRWRQIGLLLNDTTLLPWVRVAGLFIVLFAQPLVRTLMMHTDQVAIEPDGRVLVTFGEVPIQMPPKVDDLVRDLLAHGSTHSYTRTGTR